MTPEYAEVVTVWMRKAQSDLAAADVLIHHEKPLLDSGVYHCQQAAEKALKGWLTSKEVEFHKTHDLVELLNQSIPLNKEFASFDTAARNLAPFSVRFRYPGDTFEPPLEEAIQALENASKLVDFVISALKSDFPESLGHL